MSTLGLGNHVQMLADEARNNALATAISRVVRPGDIVVDIGTGTGLLTLCALEAGAAHVFAIEATNLAVLAELVFRENGVSERVTLLQSRSQEVDLPDRCDVVLCETLGFLGLDEGIRMTLCDARDRFGKLDARLLPGRVGLRFAGISQLPALPIPDQLTQIAGFNFAPAARLFSQVPRRAYIAPSSHLTGVATMLDLDMTTVGSGDALAFDCTVWAMKAGVIAGFAVWFEAELGGDVVLSSASADPLNHWGQAFLPIPPLTISPGDAVRLCGTINDAADQFAIRWSAQVMAQAVLEAVS